MRQRVKSWPNARPELGRPTFSRRPACRTIAGKEPMWASSPLARPNSVLIPAWTKRRWLAQSRRHRLITDHRPPLGDHRTLDLMRAPPQEYPQGGSIAESQAFEAGHSPRAATESRWFPDVAIHLAEVRRLLQAAVTKRRKTRRPDAAIAPPEVRHCPDATAQRCLHIWYPEIRRGELAYYAADVRYS